MIQARGLTKRFGSTLAVDDLSFVVEPGKVTGFLGPNGAGKSTTLHLMLGLIRGGGRTLFDGRPYRELACPMRVVGAMLEARALHPRRSARDHLRMLAAAARVSDRRVDQVLDQVGLTPVAHRRAGGFSLGMTQRLGLAAALLAEPRALLLDEPANGLDPHGVAWLRALLRAQAAQGRAVLVSSHLLAEMQLLADHLLVMGRGRLLADEPTDRLLGRSRRSHVLVRSPDADRLAELLVAEGATVQRSGASELTVLGISAQVVGELAHEHRLRLHELASRNASLEAAFLELVDGEVEYLQGGAGRQ
ncbi:MAG TPA: ATP-binding cassette domain-containing protein [Actinomycetes bacterium]|jgi:ABC-2 type transport system ATP-binding protein|nr:ATP-binding cassette domain-containing protein [Actinomycetes bacterium]